jgi:hypothetical protein
MAGFLIPPSGLEFGMLRGFCEALAKAAARLHGGVGHKHNATVLGGALQPALLGLGSSLHSGACSVLGDSDGAIHIAISLKMVCFYAAADVSAFNCDL